MFNRYSELACEHACHKSEYRNRIIVNLWKDGVNTTLFKAKQIRMSQECHNGSYKLQVYAIESVYGPLGVFPFQTDDGDIIS